MLESKTILLKHLIKSLFPENRKELNILLSLILLYCSYSFIICFVAPAIIQGPAYLNVDTYFSFDNKIYFQGEIPAQIRHPLIQLFIYPIILLGNLSNHIIPIFGKRLFICFICSFLISSSVLYIYKYLHRIIEIRGYKLYIITILFAFFSTNMILCFTIETYLLSAFLLSFSVYYSCLNIKENRNEVFVSTALLSIMLGGITVTNFLKGLIPLFLSRENKRKIFKSIIYTSIIFLIILVSVELFGSKLYKATDIEQSSLTEYYTEFSKYKETRYFEKISNMFLGSPILLSNFYPVTQTNPQPPTIVLDYYHHWWQYCTIGMLFTLVALSIFFSYKNKFIQILFALFLVDLVIHVILKFGIQDPFIYGSHWIYLVPLFLGWLYTNCPPKLTMIYSGLLTLICIVIVTNNSIKIFELINLATEIYTK